jgi:hypothetical protein
LDNLLQQRGVESSSNTDSSRTYLDDHRLCVTRCTVTTNYLCHGHGDAHEFLWRRRNRPFSGAWRCALTNGAVSASLAEPFLYQPFAPQLRPVPN